MMKLQICLLFTCLVVFPARPLFAADIATEVRRGGEVEADTSDGGYLEIGGGLYYIESPIYGIPEDGQKEILPAITINARYQYKGWFAEAFSESQNGLSLGYNAGNSRHWIIDLIGSIQHQELSEEESDKLEGLRSRHSDFMGGARLTGYHGNYVTQLQLLHDISNTHHGYLVDVNAGRGWQIRNWNLHALLGARYRSEKIIDYYLGVRDYEASERFPAYTAEGGMFYTVETGVTYPLAQNWVFSSFMRYTRLPNKLTGSPLIIDNDAFEFLASINFVF